MPTIATPQKHSTVLVKSIDIVGIKTGNVLEDRNVLIEDSVIFAIDSVDILVKNSNALLIDGTGKYAIPCLWDMHTYSNQHST